MTDKELIKEEIESYRESMKGLEPHSDFRRGQITAYNQIMQFIDSLPEEHNEDLEEAAYQYIQSDAVAPENMQLAFGDFINGAKWALQNQWISVEEALPKENRIIARLSESFCGTKDCIEVLHFCERYGLTSPEGYYDLCGENVPTSAITYWMPIPQIEGGEK